MIAKPPHDKLFGIIGISLTKARLRPESRIAAEWTREKIVGYFLKSKYLEDAPFSWVTLAIRYGLVNETKPHYQRISKKYGDLPLAIEVDTHELLTASLDELKVIFERAALIALIHAGKKYDRPIELLEKRLLELSED